MSGRRSEMLLHSTMVEEQQPPAGNHCCKMAWVATTLLP